MAKHESTNSATQEVTANHTLAGVSVWSSYLNVHRGYSHVRGKGLSKRTKFTPYKGLTIVERPAPIKVELVAETPLMPDQDYHDRMPEWATNAAAQAYEATLAAGYPVTIAEGNHIIKLFPNGHREVLGTVD